MAKEIWVFAETNQNETASVVTELLAKAYTLADEMAVIQSLQLSLPLMRLNMLKSLRSLAQTRFTHSHMNLSGIIDAMSVHMR
ncbi:MAG: hypothetical protein Q4C20_13770 [Erysipelotrichaceae bacterium]|nr:hypothetical protein [Erysipelotrichaceae bacterium]